MVYQVGEMILQKTQEVFCGKVNDVIVCRDVTNGRNDYYTVIVVHNRETAKKMMQSFHADKKQGKNRFIADYTWKDSYLMVFEYVKERALAQFFSSEILSLNACEQLGLGLVLECLASAIPYPVLYLQLKQRQVHISKEKEIYLGYCLDLADFSEKITERECATLCASIILDYLKEIQSKRITSYQLLEKKLRKGGYPCFTQLYKDLQMTAQPLERESTGKKFLRWLKQNQDRIFKVLLFVCITLGVVALLVLVSQMIFSDIPFMKLFTNPFKQIGTESLLQ